MWGKMNDCLAAVVGRNDTGLGGDGGNRVRPRRLDPAVISALESNLMLFFTGAAHHSWDILAAQEKSTRLPDGPAVEARHQVKETPALMKKPPRSANVKTSAHLLSADEHAKKHSC